MKTINILKGTLAAISALIIGTSSLEAQVSRALEVLQTNPDSRTSALGDALNARQDRMSLFTSPLALMPKEGSFGLDASTLIYPKVESLSGRVMQYNVAAGYKFLGRHALSLGFRYQGTPEIESFDIKDGTLPGQGYKVKPFEWVIDLAYGFQISRDFSASVSGNLIASWIGMGSYTGGASVAAFYNHTFEKSGVIAAALKFNNLGAPLYYGTNYGVAQPANFQASVEYGFDFYTYNHLNLIAGVQDYFLPADANLFLLGVGAEYDFRDIAFLRLGYRYGQNNMSLFTAGLGVKLFHNYSLDAAYRHGLDKEFGMDVWTVGLTALF